eukprot:6190357-Pleurochrysis_carterae.AAC.2
MFARPEPWGPMTNEADSNSAACWTIGIGTPSARCPLYTSRLERMPFSAESILERVRLRMASSCSGTMKRPCRMLGAFRRE